MRSEGDFRPSVGRSHPGDQLTEWLTAKKTLRAVQRVQRDFTSTAILKPAGEGYLHTWASAFQVGETTWSGVELPRIFWEEGARRLREDWENGTFAFSFPGGFSLCAYDVMFNQGDLKNLFPRAFKTKPTGGSAAILPAVPPVNTVQAAPVPDPPKHVLAKGGRPMSETWPNWVAELAALVHDEGVPDGVGTTGLDDFIARIADRLALRELESPARTTVQAAAKAVLLRLRARN